MDIRQMSRGDIIYLDWRELPESLHERNGSVSLVLGQIPSYADSGLGLQGAVDNLRPELRTSEGVLCFRARGHRHELAYGPDTAFYVLTQEQFDRGDEGKYLGRDAPRELFDYVFGHTQCALANGHAPVERGGFQHVVDWKQLRRDLEGLKLPN